MTSGISKRGMKNKIKKKQKQRIYTLVTSTVTAELLYTIIKKLKKL